MSDYDVSGSGGSNDYLIGASTADQYSFSRGDGNDIIYDYDPAGVQGATDRVIFGEGIVPGDLRLSASGYDLVIRLLSNGEETGDSLTLQNGLNNPQYQVEEFLFVDGTTLTMADLSQMPFAVHGGDGDDLLIGAQGSKSAFFGGKGDDKLYGSTDSDSYHFSRGDGKDTVRDMGGIDDGAVIDRLVFGEGIHASDIRLTESGPHLILEILSDGQASGDQITLEYAAINPAFKLEEVEFADGTVTTFDSLGDIHGTGGDDTLNGGEGQGNVFYGYKGNDTLTGSTDVDEYYFNRGDGQDSIIDNGGLDRIIFGEGIGSDDIQLAVSGNDILLILLKNGEDSGDRITLKNAVVDGEAFVEELVFADGSSLDLLNGPLAIQGTEDDTLYGFPGRSNLFNGGKGNDTLNGSTGDDQYQFNLGDGQDVIIDQGGGDQILFGEGITLGDIDVRVDGENVVLVVLQNGEDSSNRITIQNALNSETHLIETLVFDDGTTQALADLLAPLGNVISGTDGDDILTGLPGQQNIFNGGPGDDVLIGSIDVDHYHYNLGDGADVITDAGGVDQIIFGPGIGADDIDIRIDGDDVHIHINDNDSGDRITISNVVSNNVNMIENLVFADGTTLLLPDLIAAVQGNPVNGTDGDDTLTGLPGQQNIFDGGPGDDVLIGSIDVDHYHYNLGDGADVITDAGGVDQIIFGPGIGADDIDIRIDGDDVHIHINDNDSGDRITISNVVSNNVNMIENLVFADGSTLLLPDLIAAVQGNPVNGTDGDDTLTGLPGQQNIFDGGPGDDVLIGSIDIDHYHYNLGDGADVITDGGGVDRIIFGPGIGADDIDVRIDGDDVHVHINDNDSGDRITIRDVVNNNVNMIENLVFADGTTLVLPDLIQIGTDGNDTLTGTSGQQNIFDGGPGDDVLIGSIDIDHYHYNLGDGADVITDDGGVDQIIFGPGIGADDIDIRIDGDDVHVHINDQDSGDRITISNVVNNNVNMIENLVFADGTTLLLPDLIAAVQGNPVNGTDGDDTLTGLPGQQNIFNGGPGDDVLIGSIDIDHYHFNLGDGADVITDGGGVDRIYFGPGIGADDIDVRIDGDDVHVHINDNDSGDRITISNVVNNNVNMIENLVFSDGTTLVLPDLIQIGTDGNDTLTGTPGQQNIFDGGPGDDVLIGSIDIDHYYFNLGDGADVISDGGGVDQIYFGPGIGADDIDVRIDGDDVHVHINDNDSGDRITISNVVNNNVNMIENLVFADGTTLLLPDLIAAVQGNPVNGTDGDDTLTGLPGQQNIFNGGPGDDVLIGSFDIDHYHYNLGDGADVITDAGGVDQIIFGPGIGADDIDIRIDGDDVHVHINDNDSGDRITISNVVNNNVNMIENLVFADGTTLLLPDLIQIGTDGNDTLTGTPGQQNIFDGGPGDDVLIGSIDIDHYHYNLGDGADVITDGGGIDQIIFGPGIGADDIDIRIDGDDVHVHINDNDSGDRITIRDVVNNNVNMIENLVFADGTTLVLPDLIQIGTDGNDTLTGTPGQQNIFDGGPGDDVLIGSIDIDHYYYNLGDGTDVITDGGGVDRIYFGPGIGADDIDVRIDGDDVHVHINDNDSGDRITIRDVVNNNVNLVENLVFADGSTLLLADLIAAGQSNPIDGTDGDDTLTGLPTGTNVFSGGTGDDVLIGSINIDHYHFNLGDGADVITDAGGVDQIIFGPGIGADDIDIRIDGDDIHVHINDHDSGDRITIRDVVNNNVNMVENLVFADGTTLVLPDLIQIGSDGNDTLTGTPGQQNIFDGGPGDDVLIGSIDIDHYHYNLGDGADVISDGGGVDQIIFGPGIGADDIDILINGDDVHVHINDHDSGDRITIRDVVNNNVNMIENLVFADGTTLVLPDLIHIGTDGDDTLTGTPGQQNIFNGGPGDDVLIGSIDIDHYYFNLGDGADVITDDGGVDQIYFGPGIGADDIDIRIDGDDVHIHVNSHDSGDRITLTNAVNNRINMVENLVFADGTTLVLPDMIFVGTDGNDTLTGTVGQQNIFNGGAGDDLLIGSIDIDHYHFNLGDGQDVITDGGGNDRIVFGAGIGADDIDIRIDGNDVHIHVNGHDSGDRITLSDVMNNRVNMVENLVFADGTTLVLPDMIFVGTDGNDTLTGTSGQQNIFDGGTGDDLLIGSIDIDHYYFNLGDGQDVIRDDGGVDQIIFGPGIGADDIDIRINGDDIHVHINGHDSGDRIMLRNAVSNTANIVENLAFADGTVVALSDLIFIGTDGDDTLTGRDGEANIFIGGEGNDTLIGSIDIDHYHFNLGDGHDVVTDSGGTDQIIFGSGIGAADIDIRIDGDDIHLHINGYDSGDRITLKNVVNNNVNMVESLVFADGSTLVLPDLIIFGTSGNDSLTGQEGQSNIFNGGAGNDTLIGSIDIDHYHFSRGDGQDTIIETGGSDRIVFGAGIDSDDIRISISGDDISLVILLNGLDNGDRITLQNGVVNVAALVETLAFADGSTLPLSDLLILGTENNDSLHGRSGEANIFIGGAGNDNLYGSTNTDQYHFGLGDGQDSITDNGGNDSIVLGVGVAPADIQLTGTGDDIVLKLLQNGVETGDQLTLKRALNDADYAIETLVFADGNRIQLADLMGDALIHYGTDGNDTLAGGTDQRNVFYGGAGSDNLTGSTLSDTFYGGTGNDVQYGKGGSDTYYFNRGDGNDMIRDDGRYDEAGVIDRIVFGEGIRADDIHVSHSGNYLLLQVFADGQETGDQIRLYAGGDLRSEDYYVEELVFADGDVHQLSEWLAKPLEYHGTDGNNTMTVEPGWSGAFFGGLGNDTLNGSTEADYYHFNRGDGQDTIDDDGGVDAIIFGEGITAGDIRLSGYMDNLVVKLLQDGVETGDQISVKDALTNESRFVETLQFADGSTLSVADLLASGPLQNHGTDNNDTLYGGTGMSNDFYGGKGNDSLSSSSAADCYYFNRGDGSDSLFDLDTTDNGAVDRIVFGEGISVEDIRLTYNSYYGNVEVNVLQDGVETGDTVAIYSMVTDSRYAIELLEFADGTTLDPMTLPLEFHGTNSNDTLSGANGQLNAFYGGIGNDRLYGSTGTDQYHFNRGDGQDRVDDDGGVDRIIFGEGISLADIRVTGTEDDLVLEVQSGGVDSDDQITLVDGLNDVSHRVEMLQFADGSTAELADLIPAQLELYGSDAADTLEGGTGWSTVFYGGDGGDTLTGSDQADTFYGGAGYNDRMYGKGGADTYVFNRGDGNDMIKDDGRYDEAGVIDRIVFGEGISADDIHVSSSGSYLYLMVFENGAETGDQIRLYAGSDLRNEDYYVEELVFADGSTRQLSEWLAKPLEYHGSDGNNTLHPEAGWSGAFFGGLGDDTLNGSTEADFYHFNRGDGQDTVDDDGGVDAIVFGDGISASDIRLSGDTDNLVVKMLQDGVETGDQVSVKDALTNESRFVETLQFADGSALSVADLLASGPLQNHGADNNDTLYGGTGVSNDFYGGKGNDSLSSSSAADRYYFNRGDGADSLFDLDTTDNGAVDRIVFGEGISAEDIRLTYNSYYGNVEVNVLQDGVETGDTVAIYSMVTDSRYTIELLEFADGTTIDPMTLPLEFHGTNSNDTLSGANGQFNAFYGGIGNDRLYGSTGTDQYHFNRGDGQDRIDEEGGVDRVIFGEGISLADIRVTGTEDDLLLEVQSGGADSDDQIALVDGLNDVSLRVETLQFADGSTAELADLIPAQLELYGSDAADTLNGGTGWSTVFYGGDGGDTLTGSDQADTFYGGTGYNDRMYGEGGADTYYFNRGDGNDMIRDDGRYDEAGVVDRIVFGEGISADDIHLSHSGNYLALQVFADGQLTGDQVRLYAGGDLRTEEYYVEELAFADGSVHQLSEWLAKPLEYHGTDGNESMSVEPGWSGAFFGGKGNDTLNGNTESDFYYFNRGDGNDRITEDGGNDSIIFGEGISVGDISVTSVNSYIYLNVLENGVETGDLIRMTSALNTESSRVENIEFADGSSTTLVELVANTPDVEFL